MSQLSELAREVDAVIGSARRSLVAGVRAAHRSGMTQAEIAREIGRSQPEVSRLLHFHGTSPHARVLRKYRLDVIRIVAEAGGSNVKVFGSVATGEDTRDSDIDLLVDLPTDVGLLAVSRLERQVAETLGIEVDVVPRSDLRPDIRDRILLEAVPL